MTSHSPQKYATSDNRSKVFGNVWKPLQGSEVAEVSHRERSHRPLTAPRTALWFGCFSGAAYSDISTDQLFSGFTNTTKASSYSGCSALLPSLPMLPASHILKGSCRGIRCHQPIGHPLVDQGGVRSYSTQQHGEASVQDVAYAAKQRERQV